MCFTFLNIFCLKHISSDKYLVCYIWDVCRTVCMSSCKCLLLLYDFNPNWNVWQIFVKLPSMKFFEHLFHSSIVATCWRIDGHTDMAKLTGTFLQLFIANTPKTLSFHDSLTIHKTYFKITLHCNLKIKKIIIPGQWFRVMTCKYYVL